MTVTLLRKEELTEEIQSQVAELYRQLNAVNQQRPLSEVLEVGNNVLVTICKEGEKVVGIALLSTYKVISGYRAMIEDVVVDSSHRRKGIGRKLMEKLINEAEHIGIEGIMLATGHHRKPAKALYESLGFELRQSGLYNLKLT